MMDAPLYDFTLFEEKSFDPLWKRLRFRMPRISSGGHIFAICMAAWLPLFILALWEGVVLSGPKIPFLRDFEAQARFLFSLPVLLVAGRYANEVAASTLRLFLENKIVREEDQGIFFKIIDSSVRVNRSPVVFLGLLIFVFAVGHPMWVNEIRAHSGSWYGEETPSGWQLTISGWWYVWIAIPIFQFILYRWYLRMILWWNLLRKIAILNLHLVPTHPDFSGGLGFLGNKIYGFLPFLFGQGLVLAGILANQTFSEGRHIKDFAEEAAAFSLLAFVSVLGPLTVFTRSLVNARIKGQIEYGILGSVYVREFERKWIRREAFASEEFIGSEDIQGLADLAEGSRVIKSMRVWPFGRVEILQVLVAFMLPVMPLLLTVLPPEEDMFKLLKVFL